MASPTTPTQSELSKPILIRSIAASDTDDATKLKNEIDEASSKSKIYTDVAGRLLQRIENLKTQTDTDERTMDTLAQVKECFEMAQEQHNNDKRNSNFFFDPYAAIPNGVDQAAVFLNATLAETIEQQQQKFDTTINSL